MNTFFSTIRSFPVWLAVGLTLLAFALSSCDSSSPSNIEQWPLNDACELHQSACQTQHEKQNITIDIRPKPIRVARTLTVRVKLDNIYASKVELDISGLNMYMGYNRVTLFPLPGQPGFYEGKSMLAFCTNDRMDWQLTVIATQEDGEVIQAPFLLVTHNR